MVEKKKTERVNYKKLETIYLLVVKQGALKPDQDQYKIIHFPPHIWLSPPPQKKGHYHLYANLRNSKIIFNQNWKNAIDQPESEIKKGV